MRMKIFVSLVLSLGLFSCGKKATAPAFSSPSEGATYQLQSTQNQTIMVTLADNDYADTTISLKGSLPPNNQLQCTGGNGTYMTCYLVATTQQVVNYGTQGQRYSAVFVAKRLDYQANVVVNFDNGTIQK